MNKAVFVDRDGVLVEDVHLLTKSKDIQIMESVPESLTRLKEAGFLLIVVTNQTVISRGMITEAGVDELNRQLNRQLENMGAAMIDDFYVCPHHPNATLLEYRIDCDCRKPQPGMLINAAEEHGVDLSKSFMIGDRISDIVAGAKAGCTTVLIKSGKHILPPIETKRGFDLSVEPHFASDDFKTATDWVLKFS